MKLIIVNAEAQFRSEEKVQKTVEGLVSNLNELKALSMKNPGIYAAGKNMLLEPCKPLPKGMLTKIVQALNDMSINDLRKLSGSSSGMNIHKTLNQFFKNISEIMFSTGVEKKLDGADEKEAVRLFIDTVLSPAERDEMMANLRGYRYCFDKVSTFGTDEEELDYFLSMCRYHAVTNPDFKERLAGDDDFGARVAEASTEQRPELAKEFAIRDFVEHVFHMLRRTGGLGRSVSIGFSDDDRGNVKSVSRYIKSELSRRFDGIKFVVYDTSDRTLAKGRKVCVSGQLNLPGF
jgi:hypothetical protein